MGIPELGIVRRGGPVELDKGDTVSEKVSLYIPMDTYPGEYLVRAIVFDDEAKRVQHRYIEVIE